MSTELSIRRAVADDAAAIAAANLALAEESEKRRLDPAIVARGVRRLLAHSEWGVYYVAEREGRVIGQLLITFEFSDWRDGVFWWIQSVWVAPAERRRGVYHALHRYVEHEARNQPDVCGLRLYVERTNQVAQAAYARVGLHRTEYDLLESDWSAAAGRAP